MDPGASKTAINHTVQFLEAQHCPKTLKIESYRSYIEELLGKLLQLSFQSENRSTPLFFFFYFCRRVEFIGFILAGSAAADKHAALSVPVSPDTITVCKHAQCQNLFHQNILFPYLGHMQPLFMICSDSNSASVWVIFLKWQPVSMPRSPAE
ncbi:hypothetical protein CHARACLAT_018928 [Characodon lateralis]|uniref:Uncharacterized protein n=1 Tax=Characodon lateralis TaxID=208331 RepID=A0ABU7DSP8_9TELE|nr:hypothetical protein [Characodon lateralis]